MSDATLDEICVVACAEAWRGDGEILASAMATITTLGARLARATFAPDLLVSDGEDYGAELDKALATFREENLRVHCIGIGSDGEVPTPLLQADGKEVWLRDDAGRVVTTTFEESTLRQIAATTGGRYTRSTTGGELTRAIADIVKGERRLIGWRTSTEYRDLYRAALAVAGAAGAVLWLLL